MTGFHRLFSGDNAMYARFRPTYPDELYQRIFRDLGDRGLAVDVGTGTGQAVSVLANNFVNVLATDVSQQQLSKAPRTANVRYAVAAAENFVNDLEVEENTVDLVTVAAALHWFDIPAFYRQCRRALKPNGVLAAWAYGLFGCVNNQSLYLAIEELHSKLLGENAPLPYQMVLDKYRALLPTTDFFQHSEWFSFEVKMTQTLKGCVGYLKTLSLYKTFKKEHPDEEDPLKTFYDMAVDALGFKDPDRSFEVTIEIYGFIAKNHQEI